MAQSVEHVIGNDEVISSILITSSKGLLLFAHRPFVKTLNAVTERSRSNLSQREWADGVSPWKVRLKVARERCVRNGSAARSMQRRKTVIFFERYSLFGGIIRVVPRRGVLMCFAHWGFFFSKAKIT